MQFRMLMPRRDPTPSPISELNAPRKRTDDEREHSNSISRPSLVATGLAQQGPSTSGSTSSGKSYAEKSGPSADEYIPRPLLSVAPVAQTPVLLVAPAGDAQRGRYVGILALFIDEDGRVRGISASEPFLPPAFEQAARDAFMAARFLPGELDGQAVKSRLRIEVVFDNTPAQ